MRVNNDFLNAYCHDFELKLSKGSVFSNAKKVFDLKDYKSYVPYNYEQTYYYLLNVKEILDKITTIAFNPHIKATTEEVIIRSELSSSLSSNSFKETMKDTRFWKQKNNSMSPEYVHTEQYIDTFVTYENTFICMLVDAISDDINEIISNITPLVKSIEQEFEVKGISYGKHSLLNELGNNGQPIKHDFLNEKVSSKEVIALAHKLIKRIKNIKGMEYYRFNHKNKIDKNIQPTNILIHDRLYSNCYRFWLDNYVISDASYNFKRNVNYYNYVILNILNYFKDELDDNLAISFKDNRLVFDEILLKSGLFTYLIRQDMEHLGFEIEVSLKTSKLDEEKAKYYLLTSLKYDESNEPGIDEVINHKLNDYDDVILITQNNLIGRFNNLLNISIYQDFNDVLVKNLFNSLSLVFEVNENVYESICPVCGAKHPEYISHQYVCKGCKSKYIITHKNKTPLLWIKSLRRE